MPKSEEKARKRASVRTMGCRLNQSEGIALEGKLREAGYDVVPFGEPAELTRKTFKKTYLNSADNVAVAFMVRGKELLNRERSKRLHYRLFVGEEVRLS